MSDRPIPPMGDVGGAITRLIDAVSGACGFFFDESYLRAMTKAHNDKKIEDAKTDIKIEDLERRAMIRRAKEDLRTQRNIEKITKQAIPLLTDQAKTESMDEDWVANFFEKCRITSNEQMQEVWGRILAGEANSPGSFSKKTINIVAELSPSDATLFSQLMRFTWRADVVGVMPMIYDHEDYNTPIYDDNDVTFDSIMHLESLGLISYSVNGLSQSVFSNRQDA